MKIPKNISAKELREIAGDEMNSAKMLTRDIRYFSRKGLESRAMSCRIAQRDFLICAAALIRWAKELEGKDLGQNS